MSLSQYIRDNTNDGTDIAGVLIDVMNGRIHGASVSHRLTAARLLTIYGYGDVDDFTDANTSNVSDRKWAKRVRVSIGADLTRLIKANTDDGQAVVMFLIDVMEGRIEGIHVGYRLSAAKELLNRAFGKSRSRNIPKPPGSKTPRRSIASKRRDTPYPQRLPTSRPGSPSESPLRPFILIPSKDGQTHPPRQRPSQNPPEPVHTSR